MMKIRSPRLDSLSGFLASVLTRAWMGTLDYQGAFHVGGVDPAAPGTSGPLIYLLWHEYILLPFYLRGGCNIAMLLSRHQDAEVLSHAARYMGFQTIRGSTRRGGAAALRESLRRTRRMNLAITPDGPRGPRRRLAPGCIYLSSKLGVPLVALGLGYERPWRVVRAWDHFAIPRPYSRARVVASPPLRIPAQLSRAGVEQYRRRVEGLLNHLTTEAERWAEGGAALAGRRRLRRQGVGRVEPRRGGACPAPPPPGCESRRAA